MKGLVEPVGDALTNQGHNIELFNRDYQRNIKAKFDIDGEMKDWDEVSKDLGDNSKYQPRTPDKGYIKEDKIPETDMYKANQQWTQK